jgi:uncharacterized protein YbjT (DUF2867 family)
VGSRVVRHLLARADAPPVVALARRPHAVPDLARHAVRRADYDDPSSLREALADVGTLVFISSDGAAESMRRHHEHVIGAARRVGSPSRSGPDVDLGRLLRFDLDRAGRSTRGSIGKGSPGTRLLTG